MRPSLPSCSSGELRSKRVGLVCTPISSISIRFVNTPTESEGLLGSEGDVKGETAASPPSPPFPVDVVADVAAPFPFFPPLLPRRVPVSDDDPPGTERSWLPLAVPVELPSPLFSFDPPTRPLSDLLPDLSLLSLVDAVTPSTAFSLPLYPFAATPLATVASFSHPLRSTAEVLAMGSSSTSDEVGDCALTSSLEVTAFPEAAPCALRICSTASWRFLPPFAVAEAEAEERGVVRSPLRYLGWKVQTRKVEARQAARARARRLVDERRRGERELSSGGGGDSVAGGGGGASGGAGEGEGERDGVGLGGDILRCWRQSGRRAAHEGSGRLNLALRH